LLHSAFFCEHIGNLAAEQAFAFLLKKFGVKVGEEVQVQGLFHDGARYIGLLEITNGSSYPDYSRVLGIRNSHDKRFPAGLVPGSQVMVCDNLAFSGDIQVAWKHTGMILNDLTIHALDRDVICGSQAPKVLQKYREPRREAFSPRNLWLLVQRLHLEAEGQSGPSLGTYPLSVQPL
jgi:hypothetical protein